MKIINGNINLLKILESDPSLNINGIEDFAARYDELAVKFHRHFDDSLQESGIQNAMYHKWRYIELCKEGLSGTVIDIGNDKPFLSYYLHQLNLQANIITVSYEIPQTPYDLYMVDIESEALPVQTGAADKALLAEVLEHLWRDPAHTMYEINRSLKIGGELYLTTPNACEFHAIVCAVWQANPNQRSQFYRSLESGHVHIWSSTDLRTLLESAGFRIDTLTSFDAYKYTSREGVLWETIRNVSPTPDLLGESLLCRATKIEAIAAPMYPKSLFPEGKGTCFEGALRSFCLEKLADLTSAD
ncbi:methyltransferase domain-containing protein [Methylobacterium sp. D54C]